MSADPTDEPPADQRPDSEPFVHEVTRILHAANAGDASSTDRLIPLVYGELRCLAQSRFTMEKPGQTLQATALVHEAYLRLSRDDAGRWENRRHFFGAAAEAMRRILIEKARCKAAQKRGGDLDRADIEVDEIELQQAPEDILDLNEALTALEQFDGEAAELVKLRYFAGMKIKEIAKATGVSERTAAKRWAYARAWLLKRLQDG